MLTEVSAAQRLVVPLTIEQLRAGHLYSQQRFRQHADSQAVATTLSACTYTATSTGNPALVTHKHFVIKSFLPAWAQKFVGSNLLTVDGRTWDECPRVTTVYHLPVLGNKVIFIVHSLAVENDRGEQHNALGLTQQQLMQRHVLHTALTDSSLLSSPSAAAAPSSSSLSSSPPSSEDPLLFRPDRGASPPLSAAYSTSCPPPFLCLYLAFDVRVSVWGVQAVAEEFISRELISLYLRVLRLCWCWQDDWKHSTTWQQQWDREIAEAKATAAASGAAVAGAAEVESSAAAAGWADYLSRLEKRSEGAAAASGGQLAAGDELMRHAGMWGKKAVNTAVNKLGRLTARL